ncbi:HEAT repeat-containing protein 4 isoform X2 [Alosa sapidissima]|uniref:HEAT repeat-containing protein 4 isoform X2 n=1 Tax=Alosa sapidissima TaxID=34773 RepID=UPI001C0A44D8|nr:HEAT repeat-containing protein 4 isoform X2 [Alosa sapidissima]
MDVFQRAKVKARSRKNPHGHKLYKQLLSNASQGITFSEDVIMEMGPETVPYSKANFHCLYHASGPLAPIPKQNSKKKKWIKPSHSKDEEEILVEETHLLPLEPPSIAPLAAKESLTFSITQDNMSDTIRRTGLRWVPNIYSCLKQTTRSDKDDKPRMEIKWDEFVLKQLTKTTAKWIVSQQIPSYCIMDKSRLQSMLRRKYGSASATDLVNDDPMSEQDFCCFVELRKPIAELKGTLESIAETPLPVYYRVQGYSCSTTTTDKPGGVNRTAGNVVVKRIEPPQTPKLQDSLNPRAGKFVYHTDNSFEQQLHLGIAKPVHQLLTKNHDRIIMDNHSEYQKHLQESYPSVPQTFLTALKEIKVPQREVIGRTERGMRRWVALPTVADYATEIGLIPPDNSDLVTVAPKQQRRYEPMTEHSSLRYAVEEWRSAWKIKTTWQSMTIEGLKRALTDMHYHVRLGAIATCASGAVNRPRAVEDPIDAAQFGRSWDVHPVPPELLPLIVAALDDPIRRVQMAAAVCHYAMGTPDAKAREILRSALHEDFAGLGADSWMAAQLLAMEGETSRAVIQRLLSQHFQGEAKTDMEQAASLLSSLSSKTTLVRSLLAEKLNCADWRTRVLACDTISQLKGPLNKDLADKLIHLMWNDWHGKVRQKAAQALGKLGMGRQVHNELSEKLEDGLGSRRVEALVLIGQLRIMTAKLLPSFLLCLNDSFVAVRKQACHVAGELMMRDNMVMNQLLHLMQNDPAGEVKVAAISALARIRCLTSSLQNLLLWALHHELEPSVRIAACEALMKLRVEGPELQQVLQECCVLEPNPLVRGKVELLLKVHGYKLDGDKGMVHKIKDQVHKLCAKEVIQQKVMILKELESLQGIRRRLQGPQDDNSETSDSQVLAELLHEHFKSSKPAFLTEVECPTLKRTERCRPTRR